MEFINQLGQLGGIPTKTVRPVVNQSPTTEVEAGCIINWLVDSGFYAWPRMASQSVWFKKVLGQF